ncbi:hypothetical protein NFJ02_36g92190 [Pycnococcus provasolii]
MAMSTSKEHGASWTCLACTCINLTGVMACEACARVRDGCWKCTACTLINEQRVHACEACEKTRDGDDGGWVRVVRRNKTACAKEEDHEEVAPLVNEDFPCLGSGVAALGSSTTHTPWLAAVQRAPTKFPSTTRDAQVQAPAVFSSSDSDESLDVDEDVATATKVLVRKNCARWERDTALKKHEVEACTEPRRSDDASSSEWSLEGRSGHVKMRRIVNGVVQKMMLACTPSDCRAHKNDAARLKRADRALHELAGDGRKLFGFF